MSDDDDENDPVRLDCYPYTFSPLLLFTQEGYFDKGYSNYNAVAQFFSDALSTNMLENVLYDRKNMLYEELLEHVTRERMFVACCFDDHATALQVIGDQSLIFYDPLKPTVLYVTGDNFKRLLIFCLLKCNYADNQHIQENKNHYTGTEANPTRRLIYTLWRDINKLSSVSYRSSPIDLNLSRYLLVNHPRDPKQMSTQLTGNTCYFQTYLFGVLCKVGDVALTRDSRAIEVRRQDKLEQATVRLSRFLLEFFVSAREGVLRPLTNSNVVLDFYRYRESAYFKMFTRYLQGLGMRVPDYEAQHRRLLKYFKSTRPLHLYSRCQESAAMPSTLNSKSLQSVCDTDDSVAKLCRAAYYKYRAANLMFGFNSGVTQRISCFAEFNSLRKNQLLAFYAALAPHVRGCVGARRSTNKYRDYYFIAQFEVGQPELVQLHHYTYEIDLHAMMAKRADRALKERLYAVNVFLAAHTYWSTQKQADYEKIISQATFQASRKLYDFYLDTFMSGAFFSAFVGHGLSTIVPAEKEINSLTQTVFYSTELMSRQARRMEYEFEKECINQMARSTLKGHTSAFSPAQDLEQSYCASIKIGFGFTYSKYNTLMHFLNVAECYWHNPDLNSIQVFGKDIRALLAISCQKIFFEEGHTYYHYGPIELPGSAMFGRSEMDLQVAHAIGEAPAYVSQEKRGGKNNIIITDRVFEYNYLRGILTRLCEKAKGVRIKTDDVVLNLTLLSLLLDFGLCEEHASLLNLPFLGSLSQGSAGDTRALQVEVSNWISEFDKKNEADSVTRLKVEALIFEASYKFIVNKNLSLHSKTFELIQQLNADPVYHKYLLLCKIYISLCQINKSVEVDYYKICCNNQYRIIIPQNFSQATSEYLDQITKRYTFSERDGFVRYGEMALFDMRASQPEINLFKIRFDAAGSTQSMVKYLEFSNVFRAVNSAQQYVIFIADNALLVDVEIGGAVSIRINRIMVELATIFFNEAISFVPCFKYTDSEDVILFTSKHIHFLVDRAGQFNENYYGMKHELVDCIVSEQVYVDLNDDHIFKKFKLSQLITESKTVIFAPDFLLQVQSQQQLINLLDMAVYIRNVSFFVLVLFYLRRVSIVLEFVEREERVVKISGPWKAAILYVLNKGTNVHYDAIFERQFFDLNQHERLPVDQFIDVLCENFTRYQRFTDGQYQIVPTPKQKAFLQHIISAPECFHFSEVGSGKTKVILPLLCQSFLSNNVDVHDKLARGGELKHVLIIMVPEHLVLDARDQVFRYCLNLNFRDEYRIYDDIFALLHEDVQLRSTTATKRAFNGSIAARPAMKQIFITSFNQFKKALTYDEICAKVRPYRDRVLLVIDEVDDFLDRDKLVFNICSNKNNSFSKPTLECYYEMSRAAYRGEPCPSSALEGNTNPQYWAALHEKFVAIHAEIQEKSKSINKSFGIFNEQTLRHCATNIAQDIEGYRSLIARPYESVNRAMPGSYYSDVERTIYLTYYILMEDVGKYDELFQQERKFISFEYYKTHVKCLDYDDLVYGNDSLSALVSKHPETKDGLSRYLYEIILRRMEIRDKSRSVNAIDCVFNFDCIGFTGTPFLDNYPTFSYIRSQRQDRIPDMIDRSFYAYTSEGLSAEEFKARFTRFQGTNSKVFVEFLSSDFIQSANDELAILAALFQREAPPTPAAATYVGPLAEQVAAVSMQTDGKEPGPAPQGFNVLVDLCGVFKKTSIYEVRNLVLRHFGPDHFHYIYHIDQTDGSDRVLYVNSENDVQFDEEFYKHLFKKHGAALREKIFFFIDNRNVIGKDIPFQLGHQRHFKQPLFFNSVVLAHDVEDFSKIWQAMGRSRTMNSTRFTIYKSRIGDGEARNGVIDIKESPLTRALYVRNCDCKVAGNLSSIYQTLISLLNLSQDRFYHAGEIVNVFIDKMEMTIAEKLRRHEDKLVREILGSPLPASILMHILDDKFHKSSNPAVASQALTPQLVRVLVGHIVQQQFEQRTRSGDIHDQYLQYLSGDEEGLTELSYTKQQQKQRQKQQNKTQDSDTMEMFDKKHQLQLHAEMENYFEYTLHSDSDLTKMALNLPIPIPILKIAYACDGSWKYIQVYPTLQFLYSHFIRPAYISEEVRSFLASDWRDPLLFCNSFMDAVQPVNPGQQHHQGDASQMDVKVPLNYVKQEPLYSLAAIQQGVYVIGMKDQFNVHDLNGHPLQQHVQYIADEAGFILYDRTDSSCRKVDSFGPYFIEQYLIMEVLSRHEVSQNVLDYYVNRRDKLQRGVDGYNETQGKGFVCWRFIQEYRRA